MSKKITEEMLLGFSGYLQEEEKSAATIEKYLRDVRKFYRYLPENKLLTKEAVRGFKAYLTTNYRASSVNSMLAGINRLLSYLNLESFRVKQLKIQRQMFRPEERDLGIGDYKRLLKAAEQKGDERMYLLMVTMGCTGIRVSEVPYITVEALKTGRAEVSCKSKTRTILLPGSLKKLLSAYAGKINITSGSIFVTRNGRPMDRCNIWTAMKTLGRAAGVKAEKVFPHNLRHLFAKTFYRQEKDIVKLADVLGHASIETSRIYTSTSVKEYQASINRLALVPSVGISG